MTEVFRHDIIVKKGAKFYQEFQFLDDSGNPVPYTGKTLKGRVLESFKTNNVLHDLTEANGGMVRVNELDGSFAIYLPGNITKVNVDHGFYDVVAIDNAYPTTEIEPFLEGTVSYKNTTIGE